MIHQPSRTVANSIPVIVLQVYKISGGESDCSH